MDNQSSYFKNLSAQDVQTRLDQMSRSEQLCLKEGHAGAAEYYKQEIFRLKGVLEHII